MSSKEQELYAQAEQLNELFNQGAAAKKLNELGFEFDEVCVGRRGGFLVDVSPKTQDEQGLNEVYSVLADVQHLVEQDIHLVCSAGLH